MAEIDALERQEVGVDGDEAGGASGAALRHQPDDVEGAERVDDPQHERDHDDRPHQAAA